MRHNVNKIDGQYSVTSALRVGGTRKPRTRTVALTDCVCYDADRNEINRIARNAPRTPRTRRTRTTQVVSSAARRDIMLQAQMGTIHTDN